MPKGRFTQCAVVLCEEAPPAAAIATALQAFPQGGVRQNPVPDWRTGRETLTLTFRPEVDGRILVDTFLRKWPDPLDDPGGESSPFEAWADGYLGPATFPHCLQRAM